MKRKLNLLACFAFFTSFFYAQVHVKMNLNLELAEKDSLTSRKIEKSLNGFLTEAQENNYSDNYVDSTHLEKYNFFFSKLAGIGKGSKNYNNPLVLKSYPTQNGSYRLTVGFTGEMNGQAFVYQITELKAVPFKNHYRFYCPFEENTQHFKAKTIDNVTYYFSNSLNEKKATKFVNFTQELAKLTKGPIPELNYYSFQSLDELLKSYGFLYSARQCNFLCYDLGFTDNNGNTYITGTNNENYIFGFVGEYLDYNLPNNDKIYWPFVQGISTYYGGYGLSYEDMATLKGQFREKLKNTPNINFLDEFKKGRKSSVKRHFSYFVMSAFLFEEIYKNKGFDEAFKLAYSESDGKNFFKILDKVAGINEKNFHKTILRLIKNE